MQSESKKQAKTKEELIALKKEVETLKAKLAELTEEELAQVFGGAMIVNHNMAANDTNTDDDRAAIQKEINASVQQIDDNALLNFNRKYLNAGK